MSRYRSDLPQHDWTWVDVEDMEEPCCVCEMCGTEQIRYVHTFRHAEAGPLRVGCICASRLTGHDSELEEKRAKRQDSASWKWRRSVRGNLWHRRRGQLFVIHPFGTQFALRIDGPVVAVFETQAAALVAARRYTT